MKKEKTNWLKKIMFFSIIMVVAIHIEAQICPSFLIKNTSTTCQVQISYKIFNGGNCATVCSGSGITLSPLVTYAISASCISGSTDIELFVDFGGGNISAPVNFGSAGGGGNWPCYGTTNQITTGTDPCFDMYTVDLTSCSVALIY